MERCARACAKCIAYRAPPASLRLCSWVTKGSAWHPDAGCRGQRRTPWGCPRKALKTAHSARTQQCCFSLVPVGSPGLTPTAAGQARLSAHGWGPVSPPILTRAPSQHPQCLQSEGPPPSPPPHTPPLTRGEMKAGSKDNNLLVGWGGRPPVRAPSGGKWGVRWRVATSSPSSESASGPQSPLERPWYKRPPRRG